MAVRCRFHNSTESKRSPKLMVVIGRFIVFMALWASVRVSHAFNESSLRYLG